ncbi:MAG TPA: hypothetical protein VIP46_17370 [Pyrinomonadaceae bacterium]
MTNLITLALTAALLAFAAGGDAATATSDPAAPTAAGTQPEPEPAPSETPDTRSTIIDVG